MGSVTSTIVNPVKKLIRDPFREPFKGEDAGVTSIMHLVGGTAIGGTSGLAYGGSKYSEATTPKMPAPVSAPAEPPGPSAEEIAAKEAAAAEAERLRKKRGLKSTLITGPSGVTTPPTTFKTTLG